MAEPSAVRRRQFPFQGSLCVTPIKAFPEKGGARSAGGGVQITQTLAAPIYGGQRSSPEPAAASGSRPCRPAAPTINPQGILRIRRIRELQFMVPEFVARTGGSEWQSALPTGSADLQSAGNPADSQNSGTPIYGSRIRRQNRRQPVRAGSACPGEVKAGGIAMGTKVCYNTGMTK